MGDPWEQLGYALERAIDAIRYWLLREDVREDARRAAERAKGVVHGEPGGDHPNERAGASRDG